MCKVLIPTANIKCIIRRAKSRLSYEKQQSKNKILIAGFFVICALVRKPLSKGFFKYINNQKQVLYFFFSFCSWKKLLIVVVSNEGISQLILISDQLGNDKTLNASWLFYQSFVSWEQYKQMLVVTLHWVNHMEIFEERTTAALQLCN